MLPISLDIIPANPTELALISVVASAVGVLVWTIKKVLGFSDRMAVALDNSLATLAKNQERIADLLSGISNNQNSFNVKWEERWPAIKEAVAVNRK